MNILICAGIFPPDVGGPASYGQKLALAMQKRGHQVTVVTYSDKIALNRVFQRRIRILRQTCTERQFFQALFGCVPVFKRAITCSNTNVAFRVMYAGIAELYKDCGLRYHFSNLKHF